MNLSFYNFFLFLIWLGVGLSILVIGPRAAPNSFKGTQNELLVGFGALLLSMWNLMRWWMGRSIRKARERMETNYRSLLGPRASKDKPTVVNPLFDYGDQAPNEPPSSNGHSP